MNHKSFTVLVSLVIYFIGPGLASTHASQVIQMAEDKRLEADICASSMNRIAVANDRITQVFGDEGTFESQNDENLGQVFLKPTAENGSKGLSLTLVTEQGLTQDLILHPVADSAATLVLKNAASKSRPLQTTPALLQPPLAPTVHTNNLDNRSSTEPVLSVLKQAVQGQLTPLDEPPTLRPVPEGYEVTFSKSYQVDGYKVLAYDIRNILPTEREAAEQAFHRPGDLALHLPNRVLPPQGTTLLYIVTPYADTQP